MALTPPDPKRCQARVTTGGPFEMGGPPGDPKDGYRRRCEKAPAVIATEKRPGSDGQIGSMSLCESCKREFIKQFGKDFANLEPI